MYSIALSLHSWLRWAVVIAGVGALATAYAGWTKQRAFSDRDNRWNLASVALLDTQLLLGLLLYFVLSPITTAAFSNMKFAMKASSIRFFLVEHLSLMLIAATVAHVGRAKAKRKTSDLARHKTHAIATGVWLLLVAAAIPWPFFSYGRPLFRLP